jgi:hypothetical protein
MVSAPVFQTPCGTIRSSGPAALQEHGCLAASKVNLERLWHFNHGLQGARQITITEKLLWIFFGRA